MEVEAAKGVRVEVQEKKSDMSAGETHRFREHLVSNELWQATSALSDAIHYALSVMTRLRRAWDVLSVEGRHLLAGSIWPDGLIFERGSYRTSPASHCRTC